MGRLHSKGENPVQKYKKVSVLEQVQLIKHRATTFCFYSCRPRTEMASLVKCVEHALFMMSLILFWGIEQHHIPLLLWIVVLVQVLFRLWERQDNALPHLEVYHILPVRRA